MTKLAKKQNKIEGNLNESQQHKLEVEVCAQAIFYNVEGSALTSGGYNLEMHEVGKASTPTAVPRVEVDFDAWISREEAVNSLREIISSIEKSGLPNSKFLLTRHEAKLVAKA